jgi:hypothetical protein
MDKKSNEDVCGLAITHLLQRAYSLYSDARYERLAWLPGAGSTAEPLSA